MAYLLFALIVLLVLLVLITIATIISINDLIKSGYEVVSIILLICSIGLVSLIGWGIGNIVYSLTN